MLTINSAIEYVQQHLTNLGYEYEILTAIESNVEGTATVDVRFKILHSSVANPYIYTFTVWVENGKLYGEW